MRLARVLLIAAAVYAISHLTMAWLGCPRDPLIHGVTFSFFAVVAGLLIGAVGVFLGTLGNLYSLIARNDGIPASVRSEIIGFISETVREVKHDVLFTISALAAVVALQFFKPLDIPGVQWPFSAALASKAIVSDALAMALAALSFIAIYDCIRVMFLLHRHYEEIAESTIREE